MNDMKWKTLSSKYLFNDRWFKVRKDVCETPGGKKVAKQQLDKNEEIEVVLMSIDELKQLLRENKIIQSMHVSCIMYALEKLNELKY